MVYERSYNELITIDNFGDRFEYLRLFDREYGSPRDISQRFYKSDEWLMVREQMLLRDLGCDLGMIDYDIIGKAIVHHINPITREDLLLRRPCLLDPNNLITTSTKTHNKIHYKSEPELITLEREAGDTKLW